MLKLVWNEEDAHRSYYEQGREDGIKQGIEQGLKQGIELGIKQSIEQGKASIKFEMVKNLLKEKMSVDFIAKVTGLPISTIIEFEKNGMTL